MDRKLVVALSSLIGGITVGGNAYAIGLGDIKLHSALNEPLRAEIKLVQVKDLTENQIIVNLASSEDFANANVDREYFLNSLRFRLDLDDPSNPKVVVTTQQPIREPFLNFLVEVQWPSGRLLREYTLLMDLPTYSDASPQDSFDAPVAEEPRVVHRVKKAVPVEQPVAEPVPVEPAVAAAPTRKTKKTEESAPAQAPQPSAVVEQPQPVAEKPAAESAAGSYGPTRTNDTLWRIARSVRGSGSMQQKILAIQRLNPEAFSRNNANLLKTGKVLRLPSAEEIASIGRADALVKMKEQEVAWKSGATLPPPAGPQVDATGRTQPVVAAAPQTEGQLKLATPAPATADSAKTAQGSGDQAVGTEITALKNELAVGMEELNRVQREQQDATSRIKDIDAQKTSADQLLHLQSAELAALQLRLANEREAAAKAAAEAQAADAAKAQADAIAQQQAAASTQPAEQPPVQPAVEAPVAPAQPAVEVPAPDAAVQPAAEAPAAVPTPAPAEPAPPVAVEPTPPPTSSEQKPAPQQPEPSLLDQLKSNPAVAGAVAVILMLLGLFGYRKRATRHAEEVDATEEELESHTFAAETDNEEAAEWSESEAFDESRNEITQPVALADEAGDIIAPEPALQAESGDVLGEADIYISFGNYDKGEALLKSAIDTEPQRVDYRLKLLELHKEAKNLAGFDAAYKALIDLDDDEAIVKAGALRAAIPGASDTPFAFGVTSAAAEAGISDEPEFDLDFDLDAVIESPVVEAPVTTPVAAPVEELVEEPAFDLDEMDFAAQPEEQFDVSFDLDDAADVAELQTVDVAQPEAVVEDAHAAEDGAFDLDFDLDLTAPAAEPEPELDLTDITPAAQELDAESTAMLGAVTADAGEIDEELGFLSDADESATKLDLARAYIDMGDKEGARDILAEVLEEGRDDQKREAQALLDSI
jgi:pilus assembly protein FimV